MTSGSRFMNTYLNSSGVNVILAQSCRCSMMSSTSPLGSSQHATRGVETQSTVEVDLSVKVRVMEDLHGNFFLSVIEGLEFIVLDGDVLLDIFARQNDLLVLAFPVHGCYCPVGDYDRDTKDDDEEDIGLESTTVGDGRMRLTTKGTPRTRTVRCALDSPLRDPSLGRVLDGRGVQVPYDCL